MSAFDVIAVFVIWTVASAVLALIFCALLAYGRRPYERDAAECGPDALRDPGTYRDPAVRAVPPRADLHVVRPPVVGVGLDARHTGGLSLPVQARLDRASAAYARRTEAKGRGPVKPFGIGDDTV